MMCCNITMHTYVTDVYANSEIDYSSPKVEMSQDSTAESRKMSTNTFTVAANMRKHLFYYITNYQKKKRSAICTAKKIR